MATIRPQNDDELFTEEYYEEEVEYEFEYLEESDNTDYTEVVIDESDSYDDQIIVSQDYGTTAAPIAPKNTNNHRPASNTINKNTQSQRQSRQPRPAPGTTPQKVYDNGNVKTGNPRSTQQHRKAPPPVSRGGTQNNIPSSGRVDSKRQRQPQRQNYNTEPKKMAHPGQKTGSGQRRPRPTTTTGAPSRGVNGERPAATKNGNPQQRRPAQKPNGGISNKATSRQPQQRAIATSSNSPTRKSGPPGAKKPNGKMQRRRRPQNASQNIKSVPLRSDGMKQSARPQMRGGAVASTPQKDIRVELSGEAPPPESGGMAAMIAAAASKRQSRLDEGGEKKVTHVEKPADAGLDMAAMIAKMANARNKRIEAGGELKVTEVREIPLEHKTTFVDVAAEAAKIGILTRLNEHTIEAVAVKKEEEVWAGPSGLRTDHLRSSMFMAINEAAAMGQMKMKGQKAVEVTNYDQNARKIEKEVIDIDKMTDEHGRRVVRQLYLIDRQLHEEKKWKEGEWSAENAQSVVRYKNWEDVELPSEEAPKWRPRESTKTHRDLMEAISNGVAERAWERNYRLNRPKANLKVTRTCACKFCVNPNPFQTHKYKKIEKEGTADGLKGPISGPIVLSKEEPPVQEDTTEQTDSSNDNSASIPRQENLPEPRVRHVGMDYIDSTPSDGDSSDEEMYDIASKPSNYHYNREVPTSAEPIVTVLLDETTTWVHKREKTQLPPKKKRKRRRSKKKKKKTFMERCVIM